MEQRYNNDSEIFDNNLWDFDFDSLTETKSRPNPKILPVKSASSVSTQQTYKIRMNGKRRASHDQSVMSALMPSRPKPNLSRRPPSNILYTFPNFDKCDSLLYFPSTMTRHLNTGDMVALTKLFNTHLDKSCDVSMAHCFKSAGCIQQLLQTYELMNDLQPDRIMCVHNTKVVENQIIASIYMKFTDCQSVYDFFSTTTHFRKLSHLFTGDRARDFKRRIADTQTPEELHPHFFSLVDSGDDLLVYLHLDMHLTFHDTSKKITEISCRGRMTSIHTVERLTRDL